MSPLKRANYLADKTPEECAEWYRKLAQKSKAMDGFPLAGENLEWWLTQKGALRTISASYFKNDPQVLQHLLVNHRPVFLSQGAKNANRGVVAKLKAGIIKPDVPVKMQWRDSMVTNKQSELYYALHGFQVESRVTLEAKSLGAQKYEIKFASWEAQIFDEYHWTEGRHTTLPNADSDLTACSAKDVWSCDPVRVHHNDALRVEQAGLAHPFPIQSETWLVRQKDVIGPAYVTLK